MHTTSDRMWVYTSDLWHHLCSSFWILWCYALGQRSRIVRCSCSVPAACSDRFKPVYLPANYKPFPFTAQNYIWSLIIGAWKDGICITISHTCGCGDLNGLKNFDYSYNVVLTATYFATLKDQGTQIMFYIQSKLQVGQTAKLVSDQLFHPFLIAHCTAVLVFS